MAHQDQQQEQRRETAFSTGLRRLGIALTIPLMGAAVLWWVPDTQSETILISLAVIVLGLAGWWYWRVED